MIRISRRSSSQIGDVFSLRPKVWLYYVMVAQKPYTVRATSYDVTEAEYWASGFKAAVEAITGLELPITYDFDVKDTAPPKDGDT